MRTLSAKNCQTHNLFAPISLTELVSKSMHLELWFSAGISSTVQMWTPLEILGSYSLCSFVQRSILFQSWGKYLCAHKVSLAGTIAARRGIQSEQKLDLVWMRSWKKTDLDKDFGAETRLRRGGKTATQGQGKQRMRAAAVNTTLKMIDFVSASTRALLHDVRRITWTTGGHRVLFLHLVSGLRAWGLICRSS